MNPLTTISLHIDDEEFHLPVVDIAKSPTTAKVIRLTTTDEVGDKKIIQVNKQKFTEFCDLFSFQGLSKLSEEEQSRVINFILSHYQQQRKPVTSEQVQDFIDSLTGTVLKSIHEKPSASHTVQKEEYTRIGKREISPPVRPYAAPKKELELSDIAQKNLDQFHYDFNKECNNISKNFRHEGKLEISIKGIKKFFTDILNSFKKLHPRHHYTWTFDEATHSILCDGKQKIQIDRSLYNQTSKSWLFTKKWFQGFYVDMIKKNDEIPEEEKKQLLDYLKPDELFLERATHAISEKFTEIPPTLEENSELHRDIFKYDEPPTVAIPKAKVLPKRESETTSKPPKAKRTKASMQDDRTWRQEFHPHVHTEPQPSPSQQEQKAKFAPTLADTLRSPQKPAPVPRKEQK